jgi:hypothetical protein
MPKPCLTKLNRTNRDDNCFSSHVLSIALTDFLNPPHPSLEYAIQFFLIDTFENLLQALKKLVLVSHLNPFEFFFCCRKQIEITGAKSGEYDGRVWHAAHAMFFKPIC